MAHGTSACWTTAAHATFPIVRIAGTAQEICGIGFFISPRGFFLTCLHTFEEAPRAPHLAALSLDLDNLTVIEALNLTFGVHDFDAVLCQFPKVKPRGCLTLANAPPAQHDEELTILGYRSQVLSNEPSARPECEVVQSGMLWRIDDYKEFGGRVLPAIASESGLSLGFRGAPVLNDRGEVVAMHSHSAAHPARGFSRSKVAIHVSVDALIKMIAVASTVQLQ